MSAKRKVFLSLAGGFVILASLLVALAAIAPRWVRLEPVKAEILARASRLLGGTVGCESLELSWFPRPRIALRSVELTIPGKARGKAKTVTVDLSLFPLLRGGYPFAAVRAEEPDIEVALPEKRERPYSLIFLRRQG